MAQRFVIGRYYFNSLFKQKASDSFVSDLMREPYISEKTFDYAIGNIHTETEGKYELIRGTFGRVRKGGIAEVYDKEKKEFSKQRVPNAADITLEFIIHHPSHLIFIEQSAVVNPEYFADKFIKIYSHTAGLADLEIDFIVLEADVYETIKKWNRVDKVSFKKLRPSNPSSLDDFEELENLLKETGSGNTSIEFHAIDPKGENQEDKKDKGLNYESKLIKQGLALSSHGYGDARILGEEEGQKREVETKKFLKKVEVDFYEDGALKKITETIEEVANEQQDEHTNGNR